MSDYIINDLSRFRDPLSVLYYQLEKRVNGSDERTTVLKGALMGRDRNRTPMQWSNALNGGFCPPETEPWLPVNSDYAAGVNVDDQVSNPDSMINFYRRMLHVRRQNTALQTGEYQEISTDSADILCYSRSDAEQTLLVVLNMSPEIQRVRLPFKVKQILINTMKNWVHIEDPEPTLQPFQGVIYIAA